MTTLDFRFEEPDGEPACTNFFNILNPFLQPESEQSTQETANEVLKLLPSNEPHACIVGEFAWTVLELASQIPYTHPSQTRLAKLVAHVLNSQDFPAEDSKSPTIGQKATPRYSKFNQEVRDISSDRYGRHGYANFHAFLAHVYAEIWSEQPDPVLAIWELARALERPQGAEDRERFTMAAALWVLIYGGAILAVLNDSSRTEDPDVWYPGPLFEETRKPKRGLSKLNPFASKSKPTRQLTRERWEFWKESLQDIASGSEIGGEKTTDLSEECRGLCREAVERMGELEPAF